MFFLTWFPTYLVKYRGMDFIKSGLLASLPFLAAFVGVLCSGIFRLVDSPRRISGLCAQVADHRRAVDFHRDRGANYVDSTAWVIAFLAVAFFGNGLASITWSLVSTLAPARLPGLTGGVFSFIGNLAAIATPIVIGFLASGDSFAPAITYIAVLALLGALSYILLVGKVERIELASRRPWGRPFYCGLRHRHFVAEYIQLGPKLLGKPQAAFDDQVREKTCTTGGSWRSPGCRRGCVMSRSG